MDAQYQPVYKQAATLQHQFHDFTHHSANDPMANVLRNQIHGLTKDLATGKNPRTIENRLKTIDRQLKQSQRMNPYAMPGEGPIMNIKQTMAMRNNFDRMRMNIRQHPHY